VDAIEHEIDYVALALSQGRRVAEPDPDGGGNGAGVNQGEPAQGDDAQEQLGGVTGGRRVEPELDRHCRDRLTAHLHLRQGLGRTPAAVSASRSSRRTKLGRATRKSK